jgi:hypothetical protein
MQIWAYCAIWLTVVDISDSPPTRRPGYRLCLAPSFVEAILWKQRAHGLISRAIAAKIRTRCFRARAPLTVEDAAP